MKLTYEELDLNNKKDKKIMDKIISFDTNKDCFGDYDFYQVSGDYTNLAIYIRKELIGYVGFSNLEEKEYTITICIKEEYQSKGLGDIILKQTIKTLYSVYKIDKINIEVIDNNSKCTKLINRNHFDKANSDTFLKDGKYVPSTHYVYTKHNYEKDRKNFKVYKKITL